MQEERKSTHSWWQFWTFWVLAWGFLAFGIYTLASVASAQDEAPGPGPKEREEQLREAQKPEWIVVLRVNKTDETYVKVFEFRLVVKADTEGEATLRATMVVRSYVPNWVFDQNRLLFIEAQQKKPK